MKIRGIGVLLLVAVVAVQFGCGGGGGGGAAPVVQPTKALVKLASNGALPAGTLIGGMSATVTYPAAKATITQSNVATSGAAAGASTFLQANVTNPGQVILALINVSPGIQSGEFAALTFDITPGSSPVASDFAIAPGASIIDTNSAAIPGVTTITVASVTLF